MEPFYSVRQVVQFAITLEQASQQFYRRLADEAADPSVKRYLLNLVREEELHEQTLSGAIDSHGESLSMDSIPQSEVAAYIQAIRTPDPLDYKNAVRMARDKEHASRMLYALLAGSTDNPILEALFHTLEKQEIEHHVFFVREFNRISIGQN